MLDPQLSLLLFGLVGLGFFGSSSNEEANADSSSDDDEAAGDNASAPDSPFAPDADEPFDLDYKEPESPAENPFASEDEEPVDTETVPHARPDGSSPFENVTTSADDAASADNTVRSSSPDESPSSRAATSSPSASPSSSPDSSPAPPAADSTVDETDDSIFPAELDVDESVLPSDLDLSEEGQCRSESSSSPQADDSPSASSTQAPAPQEASAQPSVADSSPARPEDDPSSPASDSPESTLYDLPADGSRPDGSASRPPSAENGATTNEGTAPSPPAAGTDTPSSPSAPETLNSVSDARALSDTAMALFHEDQLDRAFDELEAHWRSSLDELNLLQQKIERMRTNVDEKYDAPIDYRFVRTDDAADALIRFSYLERFTHHGLRWKFTFYKGEPGWTLNDLSFDDDLDALLD